MTSQEQLWDGRWQRTHHVNFVLMALLEWSLQNYIFSYLNVSIKGEKKNTRDGFQPYFKYGSFFKVITKVKAEFRDSQPGLVITHSASCNFE